MAETGPRVTCITWYLCYLPRVPGSHGTVRLIDGLIPEEGTVEVCVNAVWSSVCHWSWDYKDAFVVCRQLGYPATGENNGGRCTESKEGR